MKLDSLILYCRAGFEADLSSEVTEKAAQLQVFGYPIFDKNSGYIRYCCHTSEDALTLQKQLNLRHLVFARQMFLASSSITIEDKNDRLTPLIEGLECVPLCGEVRVEHPDTTHGRELSKLCRKFTVPLRAALRKSSKLTNKEHLKKPCIFVFFETGEKMSVGYALRENMHPEPLGIMRLRFPSQAPSRSTLKLDEAFQWFIPAKEHEIRLQAGMHAVDLGACPGGWTYQLVQRGMFVQAIDNGAMDDNLMATGQVQYFAADGFKYQPKKHNVYWLVCDMIEQPQRVAKLIAAWLEKGWCKEAVFNLKLPMKQRYETVQSALDIVDSVLKSKTYKVQAKHLYHDREEITVHIRVT